MKHDISAALYDYWLGCHTDDAVRAGGISAVELAPLVPNLFLLDLDPLRRARFRFCGAALATRYGRDLTDESFLDLWGPLDRGTLERDLKIMGRSSGGMVAGVMGETMSGGFIAFEMLLLPLVGEHGGAGAIGSMARTGGHDEGNRIRGRVVSQLLRSVRFLPLGGVHPLHARPGAVHTQPENFALAPKRYGHLTLVVSD